MLRAPPNLKLRLGAALAAALALTVTLPAPAMPGATPPGPEGNSPVVNRILNQVGIDQKLGAELPLGLPFKDEEGSPVQLGDYFGERPVVLTLVYYGCPMLCTMTLNGMVKSFKPLSLDVGDQFEVVVVSFDPRETPDLARRKKEEYVKFYGRPQTADGFHFLTGDQASIDALTQAVGFKYTWDDSTQQFAHSSALMVATPRGQLSRYFYGLEYAPKDLRLGLIEAADERIGTLADALVLLCFQYDPTTGKYGFVIMSVLRIAGVLTLVVIGAFIFFSIRRERRAPPGPALAAEGGGR